MNKIGTKKKPFFSSKPNTIHIHQRTYDALKSSKLSTLKAVFWPAIFGLLPIAANAAPLELGLFERVATSPINAFITFDNSGSMLDEINGEIRWDPANYQRDLTTPLKAKTETMAPQRLRRLPPSCPDADAWTTIRYIFGTDTEFMHRIDDPRRTSPYGCRNLSLKDFPEMYALDWRPFSHAGNALYYNPERQYKPWRGYPPAHFRSVRLNPHPGTPTFDVTIDLATTSFYPNNGFHFNIWKDSAGYGDKPAPTPRNFEKTPNNEVDLWDEHTEYRVTENQIEIKKFTYNPKPKANIDDCNFDDENPLVGHEKCLGREYTTAIWNNNFGRSVRAEQQNIANWFQYYRNRSLESRTALAQIIRSYPEINFGITTLGPLPEKSYFIPIRNNTQSKTDHTRDLIETLYTNWEYSNGTPLAASALFAGDYFQFGINDTPSPITSQCDQNFHIMMTDGARHKDWDVTRDVIIDHDKDEERYHKISTALSIADIASYFYNTDLAPDLPNTISGTKTLCSSVDEVSHQSLRSIFLSYGITSPEFKLDKCWPLDNPKANESWGSPFPALDAVTTPLSYLDLWHSAFNSRGFFSFFNQADILIERLGLFFKSSVIQSEYQGPSALSHNELGENTLFFASDFDLSTNVATIKAYKYNTAKPVSQLNKVWTLGNTLPSTPVPLVSFDPQTKAGLQIGSPTSTATALTQNQTRQLFPGMTGPLTAEKNAFIRDIYATPLGPVIHSNLLYVGNPSARQQFRGSKINTNIYNKTFQDFTKTDRIPMLYFNSNNGRLYGVNAKTGQEVLSYIPSPVLTSAFASRNSSQFAPFLNGKNYIADGYLEKYGRWGTVLIGSMQQGGQGFFALDITNPNSFGPQNVLWEFTDENDADLGFTYAKPAFGVFEDEKFYAVLSNGYNSTETGPQDQAQSTTGQAALYILDLSSGALVAKLETGVGMAQDPLNQNRPNGFAEPALIDSDRNGMIDTLYVGDFFGNVYAFDVSNQNSENWKSAFGTADAPLPMVNGSIVNHQPITTRPAVTRNGKSDELLVIYGTGENITKVPNSKPNFLIAAKHTTTSITNTNELIERTLSQGSTDQWRIDQPLQATSDASDDDKLDTKKGWYFAFTGKTANFSVTQKPTLRYGQLIWTIEEGLQPSSQVTCNQSLSQKSHILAMNPFSGLSLSQGIFPDFNSTTNHKAGTDQEQNKAQQVDGLTIDVQINNLEIISADGGEIMIGSGFNAGTIMMPKMRIKNLTGRQSWRRL